MDQTSQNTNPWMVSTLILAGIIVGYSVAQIPALSGTSQQQLAAALKQEEDAQKKVAAPAFPHEPEAPVLSEEQIKALPDDDPVIGEAAAAITLIEFSDYQCSYCRRFFKNSLPQIENDYIKTGKVKLVYRDFPLDGHPQAELAAEASECADEQGKFRGMHDFLFDKQVEWSGNPDVKNVFKGYAKKLGLNSAKFEACLDESKSAAEIRKDLIDGATIGISGTPGFFVNGKMISGAMPYDLIFKPVFDAELAGKKWEIQYDALGKPSVKVSD